MEYSRRARIALFAIPPLLLVVLLGLLRPRRELVAGHAYPIPSGHDRILIEVLNTTPRQGLARQGTRRLRREGLDVIFFGNADAATTLDSTAVIARRGDADRARRVAGALGVGKVRVELDTLRRVDVTVMLGADYKGEDEVHP